MKLELWYQLNFLVKTPRKVRQMDVRENATEALLLGTLFVVVALHGHHGFIDVVKVFSQSVNFEIVSKHQADLGLSGKDNNKINIFSFTFPNMK